MKIDFWLNGVRRQDEVEPDTLLLDFLRAKGCYSVKRGCETANCGLCTVWLEEKPDESFLQFIRDFPAELMPAIRAHLAQYPGKEVVCFHSREEADAWLREWERNLHR